MVKRSLSDQLDEAVDATMKDPNAPSQRISPRIDALLRVAAELRGLPSAEFKARLKAELLADSPAAHQPVDRPTTPPKIAAHDVRNALGDLNVLSWRELTRFNDCAVGVFRFSGLTPWERHTGGDELIYALDGDVDLMTLTDDGPVQSTLRQGSCFVCPRGLWHRQLAERPVTHLYAVPSHTTQISRADDPRREDPAAVAAYTEQLRREHPDMFGSPARAERLPAGTDDRRPGPAVKDRLVAHDVAAAFEDLPDWSMRFLASMDNCTIGVSRYSRLPHWERHPDGDELLYIVDGGLDVTTLTDDGPVNSVVNAGSVFVCPKGLWHFPRPRPHVSMLFVTPGKGSEISDADDPRRQA
ncbi:MAG: cupin domain-containing protein [Candidatus Binataceae bacterium]